jgi:hypothetical protein
VLIEIENTYLSQAMKVYLIKGNWVQVPPFFLTVTIILLFIPVHLKNKMVDNYKNPFSFFKSKNLSYERTV